MSSSLVTLTKLHQQTTTHPSIKEQIKYMTQARQKIAYHALVSSPQTYIQVQGLLYHDEEIMDRVHGLLHNRIRGVLDQINRKQLFVYDLNQQLREYQEQKMKEQNQQNDRKLIQIQHVLNNAQLPLSLIKKNDKYWYEDNHKTIQAKNFVHERIRVERERKKKMREETQKKQAQRAKREQQRIEQQAKLQEQKRNLYKQQIKNKIQYRKQQSQLRQKSLSQSQRYTNSLKPLFFKLQQQDQKQKLSALQEQKKKLSEIRKLHKSIDMSQIEEHKNKLIQMQKQRQLKKIFNQPLKVSFKSKYHTSMTARSSLGEYQNPKSLYEKKMQYGSMVQKDFKPKLNENLVQQMQQRLKILRRKRVKKNPKKKQKKSAGNSDEDEDQDQDAQQQAPKQSNKSEDKGDDYNSDDDSDQDKPPKRKRGEDQDPDREQRNQLGKNYLQYMKNLPKKKKQQNDIQSQADTETQKLKYQTSKNSSKYKDYLKQFIRTNRSTIDHIDTTKINRQYNKSIISSNEDASKHKNLQKLQNQTRLVQNKIQRQEQLLKHRKMKEQDYMVKKIQIDNAVVQTIKARLAMMGG